MAKPDVILKHFPILKSKIGPKSVPAMFVYLHEAQCERNHGQTANRLAERGGLNWSELFAVLHDKPFRSMHEQEAHDGCMSYMDSLAAQRHASQYAFTDEGIARQAAHDAAPKLEPRYRFVWLNLADGSFSESWQEGEHPPESSLHEEKLAAEAGDRAPLFKLIKYVCMSDSNFTFDHHMKLR